MILSSSKVQKFVTEQNNDLFPSFHQSYLGSAGDITTTTTDTKKRKQTSTKNKSKTAQTSAKNKTKKAKICEFDSTNDSNTTFLPDIQSTKMDDDSFLNTTPGRKNYFDRSSLESTDIHSNNIIHKTRSRKKTNKQFNFKDI